MPTVRQSSQRISTTAIEQSRSSILRKTSYDIERRAAAAYDVMLHPDAVELLPRLPAVGTLGLTSLAHAADTIKVGILHSLSGTMAISETVLKDVALMTIDEINAKGGVMGKKLEPVVVDPASNWPLFAEKTKQLITQDKVAVIFGCWTSVSRKSVLPVVEELDGLLFYPVQYEGKELGNQGLKATDVPVVAFSVGEEELRGVDTKPLVGHLAAWNYFMSLKNPANEAFKKQWAAYAKAKKLPSADKPLTNDPMEATYIGIHMWKQAVEKAKSFDTDKVIAAMAGQTFTAPSGITSKMDEKNHHLHKAVFIGEVQANGQFNVVWKTKGPVKAAPWSPFIAGNDKKKDEPDGKTIITK